MKKRFFFFWFIILLSFFSGVQAQTQYSGWLSSFNTIKITAKKTILFDMQLRSSDELKQIQTLLLRGALIFQITRHLGMGGGYTFTSTRHTIGNIEGFAPEHCIWGQWQYNHTLHRFLITHRIRIEQRFIAQTTILNNKFDNSEFVSAGRFRYFIRNVLPFKKTPFVKGMYIALQNEFFINVAGLNRVNGKYFDQNRFCLSTGYRFSPTTDLEIGYMNQYVNGKGSQFINNHIIQLAGFLRL